MIRKDHAGLPAEKTRASGGEFAPPVISCTFLHIWCVYVHQLMLTPLPVGGGLELLAPMWPQGRTACGFTAGSIVMCRRTNLVFFDTCVALPLLRSLLGRSDQKRLGSAPQGVSASHTRKHSILFDSVDPRFRLSMPVYDRPASRQGISPSLTATTTTTAVSNGTRALPFACDANSQLHTCVGFAGTPASPFSCVCLLTPTPRGGLSLLVPRSPALCPNERTDAGGGRVHLADPVHQSHARRRRQGDEERPHHRDSTARGESFCRIFLTAEHVLIFFFSRVKAACIRLLIQHQSFCRIFPCS